MKMLVTMPSGRQVLSLLASLSTVLVILTFFTHREVYNNALDNILKNYSDIALREPARPPRLSIELRRDEAEVEILIEAINLEAPADIERLFEPFWTSGAGGLGIGLYQARQMLERCGASLAAHRTGARLLRFRIGLPCDVA